MKEYLITVYKEDCKPCRTIEKGENINSIIFTLHKDYTFNNITQKIIIESLEEVI